MFKGDRYNLSAVRMDNFSFREDLQSYSRHLLHKCLVWPDERLPAELLSGNITTKSTLSRAGKNSSSICFRINWSVVSLAKHFDGFVAVDRNHKAFFLMI